MYNNEQPTILENINRIIIIGDVHGDITRLLNILYHAKIFSKNLQWIAEPSDTVVVQMGDQIDSLNRNIGLAEWEIVPDIEVLLLMEKLDNIAKISGGRVLSLIGNHEIMNTIGLFNYVSQKSLELFPLEDRQYEFKFGNRLSRILGNRNIILKINNYLFCHAALLPKHLDICNNNIHIINETTRKILRNDLVDDNEKNIFINAVLSDDGIVWNRIYIEDNIETENLINEVLQRTKCTNIFIGHNTVENIKSLYNSKVIFTDAGLSRSYGFTKLEYLEYNNNTLNVIRIDE